jgi:hypothetical protein
MYKKKANFDIEVIDYLSKKGYVRRRDLLQYFMELHKGDKDYSGYSEKSINRKLDSMVKRKLISILKNDDLKRFGIQETDKRSSYLTLKRTEKITEHIDTIIEKISSDNPIKQKMALREIERYEKQYIFTPIQLDTLVSQLDTEDLELIDQIIRIIYTYLDKKNIEPYNEPATINMLRKLLNRYPHPLPSNKNLRGYVIFLLGHYNDYAVIERLKKDAEELGNLHEVLGEYESSYTANVIEEHREELYKFEEKLRLESKGEQAQFIAQARVQAMIHLGMHEDRFKQNIADVGRF